VYIRWSERRQVSGGRLFVERRAEVLRHELNATDLDTYLAEQDAMHRAFDRPVVFKVTS
jgi:hypothetical protein